MNNHFNYIDQNIIDSLSKNKYLNVGYGKMGFCIYFYILGRINKNQKFSKIADQLLNNVYSEINSLEFIDINSGLAGIGLGLHFLIDNKYVKGNINEIVKDLDDTIYRKVISSETKPQYTTSELIQILYYLYIRIQKQKSNSEEEWILKELAIFLTEELYKKIDCSFFEEPMHFNIEYKLPQLLFCISKLYSLNFYNHRLDKILTELTYNLVTKIPFLHAHKLYLVWSLEQLLEQMSHRVLEKYLRSIKSELDINVIIDKELSDKNIFFNNGHISIYLLLNSVRDLHSSDTMEMYKKMIIDKIDSSEVWELLVNETSYLEHFKGLYNGYCGVALFRRLI